MSAWAVKEKTRTWDSVFDRAWAGEPQFVSRGDSRTVVVISLRTYETSRPQSNRRPMNSVLQTLLKCPCHDDSIADAMEDRSMDVSTYFDRVGGFKEK